MPLRTLCLALLALSASNADAGTLAVEPWPLPAGVGSGQPDLVRRPGGGLLLGWIQRLEDGGHALEIAHHADGAWQPTRRVASGRRWFVNWADTPHVTGLADGTLWAHWMERSGEGSYDYGIRLARSGDGGASWSTPVSPHPEGLPLDFGFVSLWADGEDRLGIAWLDSRQKTAGHAGHAHDHHGHGAGPMALHARSYGPDAAPGPDLQLDASTCDCCTTSAALTETGPVLAYRSRREGEIRDIHVVRRIDGQWQAPALVHADGWEIHGCPVNGPVIAARDKDVWVAWYTAAGGEPALRLAHSADAGASFGAMHAWARGEAQLGRPALAADAQGLWLAWMEEAEGVQSLWLARLDHGLAEQARIRVATLQGRGRATGFPRLVSHEGIAHVVWTDVVDGRPRLAGARVRQPDRR